MKIKALLTGIILSSSMLAQASCFNTYQENLVEVENHIKSSNYQQAKYEAFGLATTSNVLVLAALSGTGGPLVSTAAGAGMIASLYLASTYIDLRIDNGVEEALAKKALLESSLSLLREARVGNGPVLQDATVGINRTVSTAISLKNLADKINEQNARNVYCQSADQIMSPAGMLKTAIDELKSEL